MQPERQPKARSAPKTQPEPQAEEEQPRSQKSKRQAAPEEAAPEQGQSQAEEKLHRKQKGKQAAPEAAAPQQQQPQAEEELQRKQKVKKQAAPEEQAPQQQQRQAEEELQRKQKGKQRAAPEEAPPASQAEPAPNTEPNAPKSNGRVETRGKSSEKAPAPEAQSTAPTEKPTTPAEPGTLKANTAPQGAPKQSQEAAPAPHQVPGNEPKDKAGDTNEPQTTPQAPGAQPDSTVQPDSDSARATPRNAAPMLDSAKEAPAAPAGRNRLENVGPMNGEAEAQPPRRARPPGPPPADDRAAQEAARPAKLQPLTAEHGRRIAEPPPLFESRRRPQGVDVVREMGDRMIVQFNNQNFVESSDRPRLTRQARDVRYEDLPRGRTRETVVREDGTQVVTIRNSYGDIVRRSRITPDGREYVLAYVDDRYSDRLEDWRDPGQDLPPMQLDVPEEDYILDADNVEDPDTYYDFLERPPVERVERLYSVDEVKRSARIRDMVPRVELTTINFDFGSAAVADSEISKLQGVAEAMERILKRNPAETFLIEGHTDAVGSDVANLTLSDQRAEAVAQALTNVFEIPPENLATQGYGERFLKIRTDGPEQANRRVVIRRITPLVAPVASAN